MDTLLVECPIHLDAVPINDIRIFKCGHGFCEPCLEAHLARTANPLTCPSCRKQVKRKETFQLFLTPASSSTQGRTSGSSESSPSRQRAAETIYRHLALELDRVKAAHAECSTAQENLQDNINILTNLNDRYAQTSRELRHHKEELAQRLVKEVESVKKLTQENERLAEQLMALRAENQKSTKALDETRKELQTQVERVKEFQGYIEKYKRKVELEKRKRKALEHAKQRSPKKVEEESLMVVDVNAPDILRQDAPDLGWLDEACEVRGDMLDITDGESEESEREREDELQLVSSDSKSEQQAWEDKRKGKAGNGERYGEPVKEARASKPLARFSSDWTLGPEFAGPSSGLGRKRKPDGNRVGGSKLVKVKVTPGAHKRGGSALEIDRHGHVKGTVALGSRQKLNSKN